MMNGSKVWLVTSASEGVGRVLVEAVLESGERVVATARDPRPLDGLGERYARRFASFALDPSDERDVARTILQARQHFGRLDVVVNDGVEPTDDVDATASGIASVTDAVLPILKLQRAGHLFELSADARRDVLPASGLAEQGVRLTRVERLRPGASPDPIEGAVRSDTECPFGDRIAGLLGIDRAAREARATARAILKAVDAEVAPRHLLVGSSGEPVDALERVGALGALAGAAAGLLLFFKP